mgnify:CR=1 FL=1
MGQKQSPWQRPRLAVGCQVERHVRARPGLPREPQLLNPSRPLNGTAACTPGSLTQVRLCESHPHASAPGRWISGLCGRGLIPACRPRLPSRSSTLTSRLPGLLGLEHCCGCAITIHPLKASVTGNRIPTLTVYLGWPVPCEAPFAVDRSFGCSPEEHLVRLSGPMRLKVLLRLAVLERGRPLGVAPAARLRYLGPPVAVPACPPW